MFSLVGRTKHDQDYEIICDESNKLVLLLSALIVVEGLPIQNRVIQRSYGTKDELIHHANIIENALKNGDYNSLSAYFNIFDLQFITLSVDQFHLIPSGVIIARDFVKLLEAKHTGVLLDDGNIVHYTGKNESGKADITTIEEFIQGQNNALFMVPKLRQKTSEEIEKFATDLVINEYKKGQYNVFTSSCQHVSTLILFGTAFGINHFHSGMLAALLGVAVISLIFSMNYIYKYWKNVVERDRNALISAILVFIFSGTFLGVYLYFHI